MKLDNVSIEELLQEFHNAQAKGRPSSLCMTAPLPYLGMRLRIKSLTLHSARHPHPICLATHQGWKLMKLRSIR